MNAISRIAHFAQNQIARFKMRWATWWLFNDYKTDSELTAFGALDGEEFFEDEIQ